jgi:hypothetical protein
MGPEYGPKECCEIKANHKIFIFNETSNFIQIHLSNLSILLHFSFMNVAIGRLECGNGIRAGTIPWLLATKDDRSDELYPRRRRQFHQFLKNYLFSKIFQISSNLWPFVFRHWPARQGKWQLRQWKLDYAFKKIKLFTNFT